MLALKLGDGIVTSEDLITSSHELLLRFASVSLKAESFGFTPTLAGLV
jgi:hypothetical protein